MYETQPDSPPVSAYKRFYFQERTKYVSKGKKGRKERRRKQEQEQEQGKEQEMKEKPFYKFSFLSSSPPHNYPIDFDHNTMVRSKRGAEKHFKEISDYIYLTEKKNIGR